MRERCLQQHTSLCGLVDRILQDKAAGISCVALTHSTQYLSRDPDFAQLLDSSETALINLWVLRLGLHLFLYNTSFSIVTADSSFNPSTPHWTVAHSTIEQTEHAKN
jgi:hypothetical protein